MTSTTATTDELVLTHLPLVGYAVSEMLHRVPPTVSRDELASAGSLALVLAAQAYDPTTGVPFARYASLRIRGALVDELRSMDWASRGARQRVRELAATTERLTAVLRRKPTRDELAEAMGVDVRAVDDAARDAERRVLSMDATEGTVADLVVDAEPTPEESLLNDERHRWLRAAVETLPDRLRTVVVGLFLLDRSVAELAAELGVTQSRISQLRTEALGLLRDGMNAGLDPDLVPTPERAEGVAERRRQSYFAAVAARAALVTSVPTADRLGTVPRQRGVTGAADAAPAYARTRGA
ncbi:sigma-70 family RNA polymerase sigma factor [Cellulomonas fimi]|uniref:RNA polymerase, sigma 28 subunit, FliA/WhiG subfamily n=1 Tax=Cellulomonas fimi (strain ATCC 484 / DSM 20113 / JCM 1341 / CCUG 24087 / LMG 16345 / NBRC 15513 / NCIMB 8980 / NCTC 7547 / NRS-133) TaxID=590998 RepID=F4GYT4_CELFA|nr:sigma-70 family RNA polymerase sigma factor [Cellulomonas fimi]AEE44803.1 RNA polymerase, sigma 28 subunit, FliA/WhiG subfamily [Cellulomonas fimi ATCC 484]NNH08381.1 sigma-70 family RNA polymerase sigma factor [Cellulomonas fimi]VEH27333.1 Sigma-F factor [Cellulomonas fimi]